MTPNAQKLFEKIINCPQHNHQSCCKQIINVQNNNPSNWHVPEPWTGDLDKSSFLIIGCNPALDPNEVYPSQNGIGGNWNNVGSSSTQWELPTVKEFFEGRFGEAICHPAGKPYVDISDLDNPKVLHSSSSGFKLEKPQNAYWKTYNEYCKAIDNKFQDYQFVVTDMVHCKGPRQNGVNQAYKVCKDWILEIIDLFLKNKAQGYKSILLIGKSYPVRQFQSLFENKYGLSRPTPIKFGSYCIRNKNNEINEYDYTINGMKVKLFDNIPAPSGTNRQASPVIISNYNNQIIW